MNDLSIVKASYLSEYKIELEFSDGKSQTVDFGPFLNSSRHSEIKRYLDLETFKGFQIVDGDLDWNDFDLTFPIWDLYTNKILKSASDERQEAS